MDDEYTPPIKIMPIDCSDWSLHIFIEAGKNIAHMTHEGEAIYRHQFITCDTHDEYMKWKLQLKNFFYKSGYFEKERPIHKISQRLHIEDIYNDTVPPLKTMSTGPEILRKQTRPKNGLAFSDPASLESQTLLRNIREETTKKVAILQEMEDFLSRTRLFGKKQSGEYYYREKILEVSKDTLWFAMFDTVYELTNGSGEISNDEIEKKLRKITIHGNKIRRQTDAKKRNRRIKNSLTKDNGFLKYAKVEGASLWEMLPEKEKILFEFPMHRVKFNNPLTQY